MSDFDRDLYDAVMREPIVGTGDLNVQYVASGYMQAALVAARLSAERQPVSDEDGGKIVRDAWIAYAREHGDTKPSHLAEWDDLSEYDKEVDRRIFHPVRAAIGTAVPVIPEGWRLRELWYRDTLSRFECELRSTARSVPAVTGTGDAWIDALTAAIAAAKERE